MQIDNSVQGKLLSAWDAEYQTMRHNLLKYKKERIYAFADLISFVETLDHCMHQLHFTDEDCEILLQYSGNIIYTITLRMGSMYDVVLSAIDKLLDGDADDDREV